MYTDRNMATYGSVSYGIVEDLQKGVNRNLRLGIVNLLAVKYGMNVSTAYGKLKRGMFRPWEIIGINECCKMYASDYNGTPKDFFRTIKSRTLFLAHMSRYGMCSNVARKKFSTGAFSDFELKGLNSIVKEYLDGANSVLKNQAV